MRVDGRLLGIGLAVSLLANLFLVGMAAGRWLAPAPPPPVGAGGFAPADQVRLLPPSERAAFERAMQPHRPAIRAARLAVRRARAQVEADMAAPTYDAARTAADLAALRIAGAAQQAAVHEGLAQALAQVSPQSRAALVEHARRRRGGGVGNAAAGR